MLRAVQDVTLSPVEISDQRPRVLLVEDEPLLSQLMVEFLSSLDYQVFAASDCDSVLDHLASQNHFDLLITDVLLPGDQDGYQVVSEVRRHYDQIGVVFMSGYLQDELAPDPENASSFIHKPFQLSELAQVMRRELARSRTADTETSENI
jgi:DNA-binding response OmpR family regulator